MQFSSKFHGTPHGLTASIFIIFSVHFELWPYRIFKFIDKLKLAIIYLILNISKGGIKWFDVFVSKDTLDMDNPLKIKFDFREI